MKSIFACRLLTVIALALLLVGCGTSKDVSAPAQAGEPGRNTAQEQPGEEKTPAPAPEPNPAPVPAPAPVPVPNPAPGEVSFNHAERAVILSNSASSKTGSKDCVYNSRDTLLKAAQSDGRFPFRSIDEIVATVIPRGETAAVIGRGLKESWPRRLQALERLGYSGWHVVDHVAYRKDTGGMYPRGVVFSSGGTYGHVSTHAWSSGTGIITLDQYSSQAFQARPGLVHITLDGRLDGGVKPTTQPGLVHRIARTVIFQWCWEAWGCPAPKYLLDR